MKTDSRARPPKPSAIPTVAPATTDQPRRSVSALGFIRRFEDLRLMISLSSDVSRPACLVTGAIPDRLRCLRWRFRLGRFSLMSWRRSACFNCNKANAGSCAWRRHVRTAGRFEAGCPFKTSVALGHDELELLYADDPPLGRGVVAALSWSPDRRPWGRPG